jgi:hypothetical protein
MILKHIFETLNHFKFKKLVNSKHIAQVSHCNFGINYVNIQDRLGISKYITFEHIWDLKQLQIKNFSTTKL